VKACDDWQCYLCVPGHPAQMPMGLMPRTNRDLELMCFFQPRSIPQTLDMERVRRVNRRKIRVLSLFDGIGAARVALEELGIEVETYYAVETDVDACAVTIFQHGIQHLGNVYSLNSDM
ncbi:DNM3B-like protein, partial [Mya arenaria]